MHAASRRAEGKLSSATGEVRPDAFLLCVFVLLLFWCSPAFPAPFEGLTVLKISPQDERAVIKTADGKTQVIKPGDVISSDQRSAVSGQQKESKDKKSAISNDSKVKRVLTVIEIAEGRVVLEERQGDDKETIIIRLKDGKQTVERVRKTPPSKPQQQMKAVSSQPAERAAISSRPSATGESKGRRSSIN